MSETDQRSFVSPGDVDTLVLDWGVMRFLSSPRVTGAQRFSAGVAEIAPGGRHPVHSHTDVEEMIYVVSGVGDQSLGDVVHAVKPGDLIHVFPGVEHDTVNTGDEPLRLLVIYSPTGPEETLREIAGDGVIPPPRTS